MIRLNDLTIGYGHRILLQHASANGWGAKSGSTDTL